MPKILRNVRKYLKKTQQKTFFLLKGLKRWSLRLKFEIKTETSDVDWMP